MVSFRMVKCPNCGQRSIGTDCQWCGYPLMKGRPLRGKEAELILEITNTEAHQIIREAKEKAGKDAEAESAKLLAEAEQQSVQIVKQAKVPSCFLFDL